MTSKRSLAPTIEEQASQTLHQDDTIASWCHSGSDLPENPIWAGSDKLAVSILPLWI